MSAERQVRTTGLCTVTVVSVTRMKDFFRLCKAEEEGAK